MRERPPWLPPPWLPTLLPCAKPPLHTIQDICSSPLPSPTISTAYRMRDNTANSLASELDGGRRATYIVPAPELSTPRSHYSGAWADEAGETVAASLSGRQ